MTRSTDSPFRGPIEFDDGAGAYRVRYDWSSGVELTTAIVELLAEVEGVDARDVGRLNQAVEPEALDRLFVPAPSADRDHGRVTFEVDNHRVTVHGTGAIEVRRPNSG